MGLNTDSACLCCCGKTANTHPISEKWTIWQCSHKRACNQKISQTYISRSENPLTISSGKLLWTWSLLSLTRTKLFWGPSWYLHSDIVLEVFPWKNKQTNKLNNQTKKHHATTHLTLLTENLNNLLSGKSRSAWEGCLLASWTLTAILH